MSTEVKGTIKDVTSIDKKGKENLIDLSVKAAKDITIKKGKAGKTTKTTVELTEIGGVKYNMLLFKNLDYPLELMWR